MRLIRIRNFFLVKRRNFILGRVACLGQDVYKLTNCNIPVINFQKARVDYINEILKDQNLKVKTRKVFKYFKREDIIKLILQQEFFNFYRNPPTALYMDSYSELTDQRFVDKMDKWVFNANFSDINHNDNFKEKFNSFGLLEPSDLLFEYRNFFETFRKNYGSIPIIFIHFPVKLDKRKKFKLRFEEIRKAIDILKIEFEPFYSIEVTESIVDWPNDNPKDNEKFPYHYNQKTYKFISDELMKIYPFNI